MKKTISVLLALVLLICAQAVPVLAAAPASQTGYSAGETIEHVFYQFVDRLISLLGKVLNVLIPGADWAGRVPSVKNYEPRQFYPGKASFDAAPAENARWSAGFAERSLLAGIDPLSGNYYMAGSLEFLEGRVPTAVADDQGVNTVALSDGAVTAVFAAVDGYGLARGDVQQIRARVADFAAANHVVSVNVSALHQHSCIDTLGLGAPLGTALLKNPGAELFKEDAVVSGRDPVFMENLYETVAASIVEAVENLTVGTLSYGSVDVSVYVKDKREPISFDGALHRLRFVPDDETKNEIWVCETGIHPVSLGAGTDQISGDYPYYLAQYVKENAGADLVFVQGAELAITSRSEALSYDGSSGAAARAKALGEALGKRVSEIETEEALKPLLNISHREVLVDIDNEILTLAGREGLLGSVFVRRGLGFAAVTEIGYMELGGALGVLLVPGEIEPAILWGGAATPAESWNAASWSYAPLAESCGAGRLICFGLCNDQIGYILCDNDVRSMLTENEEINAASRTAGSVLASAYEALFVDLK